MADTGFKSPSASTTGGWTTLSNCYSSNNTYATNTSTTFINGTVSTFAFGVPTNAIIDGIEVTAEFSAQFGGTTATIQLSLSDNGGSSYTATKSDTVVGSTDTTRTYGGATDLWGAGSFSEYGTQDGNFYVKVEGKTSSGGIQCRLDHLQAKIYYHEAASMFFLLMDD
mgnify:CR=1 FL=1